MIDEYKCQKCKERHCYGGGRVYLCGKAYVAMLCVQCEQAFRDQPWLEDIGVEIATAQVRAERALASRDMPIEQIEELMRAQIRINHKAAQLCREWLGTA